MILGITGGSCLSQIFWEHENLSGLSNYYNKFNYTKKFGKKIWPKQESGLTAVWLKWDPPVPFISDYDLKPLQQIFSIDSNVDLPCNNDFLYQLFGNYDLKMSKIGR